MTDSDGDGGVVWRGNDDLRPHLVPLDRLTPDPSNANTHPPKNLAAIRGSLAAYGQQKPIVVSPGGVIAAGNGVWTALQQPIPQPGPAGGLDAVRWTHVAVTMSDLSPAELVGYGIADNRTTELSAWDPDVLAMHLGGLRQDGVDLAAVGWDDDDIARLLGETPGAGEWADALAGAGGDDTHEFVQRTFVLHASQSSVVDEALAAAKALGAFDGPNSNDNGNALARVCEMALTAAGAAVG